MQREGKFRMVLQRTQRLRGTAGYTLVELMAMVSILGIVALAGLPHVDNRREDINTSIQQVLSDMRYARARSITTGEHFALEWVGASRYKVLRLVEVGGSWQVDKVIRNVKLPSNIQVVGIGALADDRFEFNTRGMMISSTSPVWPIVVDTIHGNAHLLSVWPSGQIYREGLIS